MDKWVVKRASKSAMLYGGSSFLISLLINRGYAPIKLVNNYSRIPVAYQFLLPVLVTTAVFFTAADHASM